MKIKVFVIYFILMELGLVFSSMLINFLSTIILAFAFSQLIYKSKNLTIRKIFQINKMLMCFVFVGCIAMLRSNYVNYSMVNAIIRILNTLLFVGYFSIISYDLMINNKSTSVKVIVYYIILPFLILAITNFLLYAIGIRTLKPVVEGGGDSLKAITLSYMKINIDRVAFPLDGGYNSYSAYIGGAFSLTLAVALLTRHYKSLINLSAFVFYVALLMVDSRAALLYPLLVCAFVFIIKNKSTLHKSIKWSSLIVIFGPLLFIISIVSIANIPFFSFLGRGTNDLQTGNSRFIIWVISFLEFSSFKPIHLIGYGEYGHFGSGASLLWAPFFDDWKDSEYKTPHNTMISIIFDYGYLGLILYVSVLWQAFKKIKYLWNIKPAFARIVLCFILYNILIGITDSLGGQYTVNFIYLFFMVNILLNIQYSFCDKGITKNI